MHRSRQLVASIAIAAVASLLAAATAGADSDLNGDGRDDLVVGLPDEAIAQVDQAGVINVIRGGANGLVVAGDRLWDQADLSGTVEANDRFGNAVAYGDFDGDGFDDVAIGAPTEAWNGRSNAGVVHVVYGSSGLNRARRQIISQASMRGKNEDGDFFGAVLAAGDFDDDGRDDLAIGAPGEDIVGNVATGGVGVIFGSGSGLNGGDSIFFTQRGTVVPGRPSGGDGFGAALTVGDFDGDGHDDLAVGIPGKDRPGVSDVGRIVVFYGRNSGLNKNGTPWNQVKLGLTPTEGDWFGYSLAAGDFNNDGDDDLAIGIRFDDAAGTDAGAVAVMLGSSNGVTATGAYALTRSGAAGAAQSGDEFGYSLAAGDIVAGGADDLVIGVPLVDVGAAVDSGAVYVLPGSNSGTLSTSNAILVGQGPLNNASDETGDRLGESLRIGDFNGDSHDDLVVSSPFEDINGKTDSGAIYVVYSDGVTLDFSTSRRFHQGTRGIQGMAEPGDRFGTGL